MTIQEFLDRWAFKAEMGTHRGQYQAWGHAKAIREEMKADLRALVKLVGGHDVTRGVCSCGAYH